MLCHILLLHWMFAASVQMSIETYFPWKRPVLRMRTILNRSYQSEPELNSPTSGISYGINLFYSIFRLQPVKDRGEKEIDSLGIEVGDEDSILSLIIGKKKKI